MLDSNIIFSATRDKESPFLSLWVLPGIEILISQYILEEVSRHFPKADDRRRLWHLVYQSHLVPDGKEIVLPPGVDLPAKDCPIMQCAIAGHADLLVTGDKKHFAHLFGSIVSGVLVESAEIFKRRYPLHFQVKTEVR